MKIILVHPDDAIASGSWTDTRWDLIVDLGWSGRASYAHLPDRFGCSVFSIYELMDHQSHRRQLRELLSTGLDHLVDSESIDWWDLFAGPLYQQIEHVMLASVLAEQFSADAEIFATRPHFATQALAMLTGREIRTFSPVQKTRLRRDASRLLKKLSALGFSQIVEIAFDKWDGDYRLRRLIRGRRSESAMRAVLLPSAYVNVSRTQIAYACMLPDRRFLMVATRQSGRRVELPANVELRSLASYVPGYSSATESERVELLARWEKLRSERLAANRVLGLATKLHLFDSFPRFLKSGLRVRDTWREVLSNEPIQAVFSADEHNPFTRLPTLLASSRRLPTISCDHGALNMTYGIRGECADVYLAAGEMARDYMISWCGLPADKIRIGGPAKVARPAPSTGKQARDWIVFFSEAYEVSSARTEMLYSELLPEVCLLARQTHRKLIVKLHPFESFRARWALINKVLSEEDRAVIEMREGPMTPDLLERAWFSVTVESSVAVESTSNGVPCFLCGWFDGSWYDYGKQYARYSAGYALNSPECIRQIPKLLEEIRVTDTTRQALHAPISSEQLDSILFGASQAKRAAG
jgi:hypothetical protein